MLGHAIFAPALFKRQRLLGTQTVALPSPAKPMLVHAPDHIKSIDFLAADAYPVDCHGSRCGLLRKIRPSISTFVVRLIMPFRNLDHSV